MNTFVGAEYVMANTLIALKRKGINFITFEKLREIGFKIQTSFNEQGLDAIIMTSGDSISAAIFDFSDYFHYKEINGKWLNEEPYGVVHRVASTGIVRGAASFCLDWAYAQTQNLRMDTYSDNIPMQKLLEKCGFQYCGSFERLGMDKWMAYQKI